MKALKVIELEDKKLFASLQQQQSSRSLIFPFDFSAIIGLQNGGGVTKNYLCSSYANFCKFYSPPNKVSRSRYNWLLSVSPGAMHWVVSSYRSYSGIKTTSIGTASMAWFVDTIVWKSWFGLVRVEKRNVRKVLIYLLREIQYAHIVGYLVYLYTGI